MKKIKAIFKLTAKIILLVLITIIILEVELRIFNKINPLFILPSNTYNRVRGRPFSRDYNFILNSKGFKDVEFSKEKKQNIFRILGIGDSIVFGVVPYQHNFLTLLEERLNQNNKSFEVINMGIPHLGVDSYLSILINEGLELEPDLVICCFFIGNDFFEKSESRKYSYLFAFIKRIFKILPKYTGKIIHAGLKYDDNEPSLDTKDFLGLEKARSAFYLKDENPLLESKLLHYAVSHLRKMRDICAQRNIKFLVIIVPDQLQLYSSLQTEIAKHFKDFNLDDFDFTLPNRLLTSNLKQLNIDYLDLLNDFLKVAKTKRLYKPNDTHWNIAGNELTADLIFDKLKNVNVCYIKRAL